MTICIYIWVLAVSANIYCFLIFKLHNNLYKCWITKSSSEDINHINLLLTSRLLKLLYSLFISSKNSFLSISNFGHCNKKWHSSSISILHNLHLRSCAFHPRYFPFSISKSWALIRNFVSKKWECAWVNLTNMEGVVPTEPLVSRDYQNVICDDFDNDGRQHIQWRVRWSWATVIPYLENAITSMEIFEI